MKVTIETEWLTIIVQIFSGSWAQHSHAIIVPRLTGDAVRLTIPELCTALKRAAKAKRA
jgi:hypothetical protein